ncbi:MAG: tyrosine-type recombinase/integrase [Inquilinus sp.]|uniref:tyrosine-type recombinase/integrase n=1 Tax=Inquilinus sp. TaxID=1932117 RepID=UPI003F3F6714
MPRTAKDARLDTRTVRTKLAKRREPYWRPISEGLAIGYRKGEKGGTWIARHYTSDTGRRFGALGTADDLADADGVHVLSFHQAQEAARSWFGKLAKEDAGDTAGGPYSVREALEDYLTAYERRGGKAASSMRSIVKAHIVPTLGDIDVTKLLRRDIDKWFDGIAKAPPRLRTRKGEPQAFREANDSTELIRRRRASANRILTVLKAGLNHAHHAGRLTSKTAWELVKPFREVDVPKVRYLSDAEAKRLTNACPADLRAMIVAALLTGCRYSELAAMRPGDFNAEARVVTVARSKAGKARHVALTDEGAECFTAAVRGKKSTDLIFLRADGEPWGKSHQHRPITDASAAARISPAVGFHILRHTYASRLAMRAVPMAVIAAQLGHADTRMTERHYAHLAPNYVADTVRAAFDRIGLVKPDNIKPVQPQ